MVNQRSETQATRHTILLALADGQFHSGEALGKSLGMSRAAISNHIKEIQALGLDIFSVTGKGYRLPHPIKLLDADSIQQQMSQGYQAIPVEVFDNINSTNSYLLERVGQNLTKGHSCMAEAQQAGRGRRGKQWVSPLASHLYFSMYWQLSGGLPQSMGLSLVVGLAVVQALEEVGVPGAQLKWPNDLYYQGKKLAGILVEMEGQTDGPCHLVIGIGVNVNMPQSAGDELDQPWADLFHTANVPVNRNLLAAKLIDKLVDALTIFEQQGFAYFQQAWNDKDAFANQQVKLFSGQQQHTGICRGVDNNGAIQIAVDGMVTSHFGGELSLRLADSDSE